jgi:hypothetical protein
MKEFKYLKFPNTKEGQEEKIEALQEYSEDGWRVVAETITPGKFKGGDACCLFLICAPCAFLAGSTDGEINITLERELTKEMKKQREVEEKTQTENFTPEKANWKEMVLWLIIGVFSLIAIGNLLSGNFISAIGYFLMAVILLPITEIFLKEKYKFNLTTKIKIISIVIIFLLTGVSLLFSLKHTTASQPINTSTPSKTQPTKQTGWVGWQFYNTYGLTTYIIIPPENQTKEKLETICNELEQQSSDPQYFWGFKSERIAGMMREDTNNMSDAQANEWGNEIDAGEILQFNRNSKAPINNCIIGVNGWTEAGAETINY